MYHIIRSEPARQDIKNIARYIAKDNPYKAVSFVQGMIDRFESLVSNFPRSGKKYKDFYLYVYHKNYFIFYDIKDEIQTVELLRIINSAQYTEYQSFVE